MNKITFLSVALLTLCLLLQSCGKDEPIERRGTSIVEVIVRNPQGEPQADKTVKVFNASDYETFKNNPLTKALLESRTDKEGKARFTLDAEEWFKGSRSAQDLYVVVEESDNARNYRWWSQLVTVRPGRRRIVRMETGDEAEHISPDSPTRHKYLLISNGVVTGLRDSSVTHLVFPAEVRSIADGAFRDSRIESVVLNEGLESIGTQAFAGSRQLSAVTLPSSLKTIGPHAFEDCIALTGIDLSVTALRRIENETFRESGLKVATLPQTLEQIVRGVCDAAGASYTFRFSLGYASVINKYAPHPHAAALAGISGRAAGQIGRCCVVFIPRAAGEQGGGKACRREQNGQFFHLHTRFSLHLVFPKNYTFPESPFLPDFACARDDDML